MKKFDLVYACNVAMSEYSKDESEELGSDYSSNSRWMTDGTYVSHLQAK